MFKPQFLLLLLISKQTISQTCNRRLMESYDVTGQENVVKDPNSVCVGIKNNCCGAQAQLDIYKRWSMGPSERVNSIYTTAESTIYNIFLVFSKIEALAIKSIPYSSDIKNSNCKKMAVRIHELSISSLAPKIQNKLLDATTFLRKSRMGFYCSLCDADSHKFYDADHSKFTTSGTFCAKLSTSLLNYYTFRYKYFPQISRLYSQWAVSCDINGNYNSKAEVSGALKFFRQSNILGNLVSCYNGYKKPGAILACKKLCRRFNPVKFDRYLEGELDKIDGLAKFLKRKIRKIQGKFDRNLAEQTDIENTVGAARKLMDKRRLQGEPKAAANSTIPEIEHLNEAISEVSYFNRKFKTGLVPPIVYDFKNDFKIKFSKGLYESIFPLGSDPIVNLQNFKNVIAPTGIDFESYGTISKFDYSAAQTAFKLLNKGKGTGTLDQYLKTMK